jgi:quercetin 2,3-dioxygenase
MNLKLYTANKREHVQQGNKFDSWQSFSFGNWHDEKRMNFGTLRVFNDDSIGLDSEIGMHPHQNYEILSVMLDGKMSHKDSLNNYQEINTNAIQLISCGKGIYHAGKNLAPNSPTKFLQIWVLPSEMNTEPTLQLQNFDSENCIEKWDLRVSPTGSANTLKIKQNCFCSRGTFQNDTIYKLNDAKNGVWLFILNGSIQINTTNANTRDACMITNTDEFSIKINSKADLWLMELPLLNN